jgi:nucleotide-binding universal stress UspA family protein
MRTNQAKQFKGDNVIADYSAKAVVVGIDGSQAAVAAAAWGAGEALHRDVALKLIYVIDRNRAFTPGVVKAQHFVAEAALRDAHAAIEATQKPVKLELETVSGDPGTTLIEESWSAVLLCVGAPKALPHGPCDSLAANMAASAHCSVAIVPAAQYPAMTRTGWVAAFLNSSTADDDVLQQSMEEAQLRELPLRVVRTSHPNATDLGSQADAGDVQTDAAVDESLVNWARRYPGIDMRVVHTDQFLRYVAAHETSIQSVVLGAEHHEEVAQLVELTRSRAPLDANPSVLVVRGQHL